ncbi:MAG: response regulator transcription factor [Ignavibacteria bacterium]|nr:response regulator transcription factor [Ignavibacteria bacterium]
MKILIVDDHLLFRDGLKRILQEKFPNVIIGEASNYSEVINHINKSKWDIVILDLNIPGKPGFETLIQLKMLNPDLKVLILSMYPESQFASRAIKAGAKGYLTKGSSIDELIEAINSISRGEVYFTKEVANIIADELQSKKSNKIEILSNREYQIFLMFAQGERSVDIAEKLSLSVKTISTFRQRIFKKMGFKNYADLVKYALINNLIDNPKKKINRRR